MTDVLNASANTAYHPVTRWLHAGLVLGVVFQLSCAALMAHPDHTEGGHATAPQHEAVAMESGHAAHKTDALGNWLMAAHRTGGTVVALFVLANLWWAIVARGKPRKRQITVLFSGQHWREALSTAKQLPYMLFGKRALPEPGNVLSRIFEMFGLLVMTAMAITGSLIWNAWAGPGSRVSTGAQ